MTLDLTPWPSPEPWPPVATQRRPWEWPRRGPKPPRGDRQFHEFDAAAVSYTHLTLPTTPYV